MERGIKINSKVYQGFLKTSLLPWARDKFGEEMWTYQQDGAPSHTSKSTQKWLARHCPQFLTKEEWPPSSPDLNPLDFSLWLILESKVNSKPHKNLDSFKASLTQEWDAIPGETVHAACAGFCQCLHCVVKARGGHIE